MKTLSPIPNFCSAPQQPAPSSLGEPYAGKQLTILMTVTAMYLQAFAAPLLYESPCVEVLEGFWQQGSIEGVVQTPILSPQILGWLVSVHGLPARTA